MVELKASELPPLSLLASSSSSLSSSTVYYQSGRAAVWLSTALSVGAMLCSTLILPVLIGEMDQLCRIMERESAEFVKISDDLWEQLMALERQQQPLPTPPVGAALALPHAVDAYWRAKRHYETFLDRLERKSYKGRQRMLRRNGAHQRLHGVSTHNVGADDYYGNDAPSAFRPLRRVLTNLRRRPPMTTTAATATMTTARIYPTSTVTTSGGGYDESSTLSSVDGYDIQQVEVFPAKSAKANDADEFANEWNAALSTSTALPTTSSSASRRTSSSGSTQQWCQKRGPPGVPGEDGIPGVPGTPGAAGRPGRQGVELLRDVESGAASTCLQCPQGAAGPPGKPGPPGVVGPPGVDGMPGDQMARKLRKGPPGPIGDVGESGTDGKNGIPGVPGDDAVRYLRGPPGERGPSGVPGERGAPGEPGADGAPGTIGGPGLLGQVGLPGRDGAPGAPGLPGPAGYPGIERHYCNCPIRSIFLSALRSQNINVNDYLKRFKQRDAYAARRPPSNDDDYLAVFKEYARNAAIPYFRA